MMQRMCIAVLHSIESINMQLNSQLPFAYTHLITCLVNFATLLAASSAGLYAAAAPTLLELTGEALQGVVLVILIVGMLFMTTGIADPFGTDVTDFADEIFHVLLWRSFIVYDRTQSPSALKVVENCIEILRVNEEAAKANEAAAAAASPDNESRNSARSSQRWVAKDPFDVPAPMAASIVEVTEGVAKLTNEISQSRPSALARPSAVAKLTGEITALIYVLSNFDSNFCLIFGKL